MRVLILLAFLVSVSSVWSDGACKALNCKYEPDCPLEKRLKDPSGCPTCECFACGVHDCLPDSPACEHGFKLDENECETCECECSDVMCAMFCENGFKTGTDGCPICECQEIPCFTSSDCPDSQCCLSLRRPIGKRDTEEALGHCKMVGQLGEECLVNNEKPLSDNIFFASCPCGVGLECNGKGVNDIPLGELGECEVCEHAEDCATARCGWGWQIDDHDCPLEGCPCNPEPPCPHQILCPEGVTCPNGYKLDKDGCQTCECECSDVMCAMYCENGFKTGVDGCPICECIEPECEHIHQCAHKQCEWRRDADGCPLRGCPCGRGPAEKDGQCPVNSGNGVRNSCSADKDCHGKLKCCGDEDNKRCRRPIRNDQGKSRNPGRSARRKHNYTGNRGLYG